jgi:hypothetical protein
MITLEELKAKFPVRDVRPYGKCIVIPGAEFDPDWEVFLGDQGYKCHMSDIYGKPVTLVKLKRAGESEGEKEVYQPHRQPPSPWQNPESRWKAEEDELIIALWNQKQNVLEIHTELRKRFPNRTKYAVKCRVSRLIKAGKIHGRWHHKEEHKPKPEMVARAGSEPATSTPMRTPTFTPLIEKLTKDVSGILDILDTQNQVIDKLLCTVLMQGLQIKEQRGEFTIPPGLWIHYANALLEEDKEHREKFRFKVKQLLEASS